MHSTQVAAKATCSLSAEPAAVELADSELGAAGLAAAELGAAELAAAELSRCKVQRWPQDAKSKDDARASKDSL